MTMTETAPPKGAKVNLTPTARAALQHAAPAKRKAAAKAVPAPILRPDPVDVYVGHEIRSRRRRLDLSQTDLANACRVTFQQVQKYERGANRVSASMLVRVAGALRCTPGDLFPKSENDPRESPLVADAFAIAGRHGGIDLMGALARAHPDDLAVIANVLRVITALRESRKGSRR